MLGENDIDELYRFRLLEHFHSSEIDLIDFVIQNKRLPHFSNELKQYLVLLRLKKKLKKYKSSVFILTELFEIFNKVNVSNKLIGGDID